MSEMSQVNYVLPLVFICGQSFEIEAVNKHFTAAESEKKNGEGIVLEFLVRIGSAYHGWHLGVLSVEI